MREERRRLEAELEFAGPPAFLRPPMAWAEVFSRESGVLTADLLPGRYAVMCVHEFPPSAVFLVPQPLDVVPE